MDRRAAAFTRSAMSRSPADPPPAWTAALTPVGARYSPKTSRSAPAHSPVVPPAWARSIVAGMMFSPDSAAPRSWSSERLTASLSRSDRHACTSAIVWASRAGSTLRMWSSPSRTSADPVVSVKRLTPTTVSSPSSMRRRRSAWLRTSRPLSSSMASKAPPIDSTSSSSAVADSASSAVRASTTFDPSNTSGYSSRSVS